jgi:thymidylate synthase
MFLPRLSRHRPVEAWLAASQAVHALSGHEAHHVLIDIEDPMGETATDRTVIAELDTYLGEHSDTGFLVRTVANTIFPQSTYEDHGAPEFYDIYIDKVFPKLKRSSRDWGRYFERMMAYPGPDGPDNLLDRLVKKMKRNIKSGTPYRNIYELPIYNPVKDADGSPRGGQCLSFLSFKLDKDRRILLSAVYRNHYYTEKLLGNIIGLGRLMQFVADQTGATVGPLSILSTHAVADTGGASQAQLKALYASCAEIIAQPIETAAA